MKPAAIVAFGCALFGAAALAQNLLQQSTLVAAAAGAVIAELGGGKIGVAWNDPDAPPATTSRNVQHAGIGLALGSLAAALALGVAVVSGGAAHEVHGAPLLGPLALGALESLLVAVQIEILQRGVLRAFCKETDARFFVPLAVIVGVAASAGKSLAWPTLLASGTFALALALVWRRAHGALVPICVHAAFRFGLVVLASGTGLGFVGRGAIAGAPLDAGLAAAASMLVLALSVWFWPRPRRAD